MSYRFGNNQPSPRADAAPASNGSALTAGSESSVRQLIANGKYKVAVESAKEIYKAQPTAASEALLVDAYAARVQSLVEQDLAMEAKALRELVLERYPSARERLDRRNGSAGVGNGRFEELLRELNDPELNAERRAAIEIEVAREVTDLQTLADCAELSPEHPLRKAASALQRALRAVTEGPVGEEAVELPEVSHRSPLAPWKLLVRAIACFYRGDDTACRRYVESIKPESAPARLVPAMQAMLGGKPSGLTPASAALASSTTCDTTVLRKALELLEEAFGKGKEGTILKAIREAVRVCRETAPDRIERLKQHISARCALVEMNKEKVRAAMGGDSRHDAYFLRLLARGLEELGDPEKIAIACGTWDAFHQQAVREGWFAENSPEAATLYLHMAIVLQKLPRELLSGLQRAAGRKTQKPVEELYYLYPERLYERACALDPHFESFSQWMEWAKRCRKGQAERVAEAWHRIRPMDIEPILLLMEEKERRNAFHTSLQYLAKAECIDSVHPAVRRARLRLLARSTLRHLQQKKPNLADEKLVEMEKLPQSRQGDRPAFLAALRYMTCAVRGASEGALAHRAEVERVLGSQAAAALLISAVANASKHGALEKPPSLGVLGKTERAALPEAVVRVVELAKDMQMSQSIPGDWMAETAKQFPRSSQALTVEQLQTLAEAGLCAEQFELAFAITAAGLGRGGPTEPSFLLLRAMSLPKYGAERWAVCAVAAAQLARQQRHMDVVEKAVELVADSPFSGLSITPEQASTVLGKEKAERTFPTPYRPGPDYSEFIEAWCDCPECRRARGEAVSPIDDLDGDLDGDFDEDDDIDVDTILDGMELPPDMPPEIARMLFEETSKAVQRGESIESLMNRLFGPMAGFGGRRKKGRRR